MLWCHAAATAPIPSRPGGKQTHGHRGEYWASFNIGGYEVSGATISWPLDENGKPRCMLVAVPIAAARICTKNAELKKSAKLTLPQSQLEQRDGVWAIKLGGSDVLKPFRWRRPQRVCE